MCILQDCQLEEDEAELYAYTVNVYAYTHLCAFTCQIHKAVEKHILKKTHYNLLFIYISEHSFFVFDEEIKTGA